MGILKRLFNRSLLKAIHYLPEPLFLASKNPYPIWRFDQLGKLLYANPAARDTMKSWQKIPRQIIKQCQKISELGTDQTLEIKAGEATFFLKFVWNVQDKQVDVYGFDISSRKTYQAKLNKLEQYDALTGLPNRQQLFVKLTQAITFAQQEHSKGALLIINIDHFKIINQTLGHDVADNLLVNVANRLAACVPVDYTIARLAQDEFAVIRANLQGDMDAANLAQVILDNLSEPYVIKEHDIQVSHSIGITVYPNDGEQVNQLLGNASLAVTKAKETTHSDYHFYNRHMRSVANARRSLLKDLRHALAREQLLVYYQPIVSRHDYKILGLEALVRWQHPEHGLMLPSRFTPLAEEYGLIIPLGIWVLETACQQTKKWHEQGFTDLKIAINVSPLQFKHPDLVDNFAEILKKTEINPSKVELEITETVLIDNIKHATKILKKLHNLGVQLAIDDFGTGYSSLNYLENLPVDQLKIDKCFVDNIDGQLSTVSIIDDIIALGHKLNKSIIAEGVETQFAATYLQQCECDELQGYFFSEPIPASQVLILLQATSSK